MKIFIDTNVLISSFTSDGVSRTLVDLLDDEHEMVVSPQVIEEFRRIVTKKFVVAREDIDDFISALLDKAELCSPPYPNDFEIRDPNDIDIVGAAIKSQAGVIASGDKDLLDMPNPPVPVMRPRQLYDWLTVSSRT